MKLGLINSAWFGSALSTEEGIRATRRIGFDAIDILCDPLEASAEERRMILRTCQEEGLPIISTACVALGLSDFNPSVRRFHLDRAQQHLLLASEFKSRNLLLVLGEYIWQQEVIAPRDQWSWAVEAVRDLGKSAAALGLEIALELEPFHFSLIHNVTEMVNFLDDVGNPAVKANLDISHLALAHDSAEEIKRLDGRIGHVHLSDCDGARHGDLPPGRGVVKFEPYLLALKRANYEGTISIELEFAPDPRHIVEWVEEAYLQTNRMMNELDMRS